MAKVDWITWKTNIKEIINPEQELTASISFPSALNTKPPELYIYFSSVSIFK